MARRLAFPLPPKVWTRHGRWAKRYRVLINHFISSNRGTPIPKVDSLRNLREPSASAATELNEYHQRIPDYTPRNTPSSYRLLARPTSTYPDMAPTTV